LSYLELQNLVKHFDKAVAVEDFSLSVDQGEFISLLGPSGCGKTTTLRMIAGFEQPDAGNVLLDGESIIGLPPHKRGMGMVFQNYALFPNMTAWGNIAFGLRVAGQSRQAMESRVAEMLALVGLGEAGHKYPHELSGGQQQRVALARALAIKPHVLLLDEPLSALDAVVRVALRHEIRRIQTQLGITTVYVTHDQEEALSISDRVVVMSKGAIEQVGTPEVIYTQPATHFVANFIGTVNELHGELIDPAAGLVRAEAFAFGVPPAASAGMPAGRKLLVLVRPEAVHVSSAAGAAAPDNGAAAVLAAITFLGPVSRLSLDLHGQRIVADISTQDRGQFRRGETVHFTFSPDACQVMPDLQPSEA
jgi:putative spermidine/putrescine transport system ATP-binding protein